MQVLDVQHYPDLRQYPGGPPERPYDAAGWTLPLQMAVKVIALKTPLTSDARARIRLLGPMPDIRSKPSPCGIRSAGSFRHGLDEDLGHLGPGELLGRFLPRPEHLSHLRPRQDHPVFIRVRAGLR